MKARIMLCVLSVFSCLAVASHHFESEIARKAPNINQLDNYVFPAPDGKSTVFIMTVNPDPKTGPDGVFASDTLYNIHVADDVNYRVGKTFSWLFNGSDSYQLYLLDSPNAEVGAKGQEIASGKLDQANHLDNGISVWAGVVKDPFFGNSTSLFLLRAQLLGGKPYDPSIWAQAQGNSIFIGRKAAAIVLEVPNELLGKTIRVFSTTAQEHDGHWVQLQYSANPLFSHTTLFENEALQHQHDQSRPDSENTIAPLVSARVARATALAKSQQDPQAYGDKVAAMLLPDVLTYTVGTAAQYTPEQRNGRGLDDDAMSTILTLLLGTPTDQKIDNPKLHTDQFPYLLAEPLQ